MIKTVVITGSTRGIGLGLAKEFLRDGNRVVISGRSDASVADALIEIRNEYLTDMLGGFACDVSDYQQVENLWKFAENLFGKIDIWINNAGISHEALDFSEISPEGFFKRTSNEFDWGNEWDSGSSKAYERAGRGIYLQYGRSGFRWQNNTWVIHIRNE